MACGVQSRDGVDGLVGSKLILSFFSEEDITKYMVYCC